MALIVYFTKVQEDPEAVRYRFGMDDPARMARTLVFDKATARSTPEDGRPDVEFQTASRKISSVFRERGTWPEKGAHVS